MAVLRLIMGWRHVDRDFYVRLPVRISRDLVAGAHSFVNRGSIIGPRVKLGRYVLIGPEVAIVGGDHRFDTVGQPIVFSDRPVLAETTIEDDVWIGTRAIIMTGTRIGRGAIVAAGAVVTRDIQPYTIVGGVPAKIIAERFTDPQARKLHDAMLDGPTVNGKYTQPKTAAKTCGNY
jgi:acetyltransferase-like isoleucine patch superfamily enzyme